MFEWLAELVMDLVMGTVVLMAEVLVAHGVAGSGSKRSLALAVLSFIGGAVFGLFSWLLWTGFMIHETSWRIVNLVLGPLLAGATVAGITRVLRRGATAGFPWRPALYAGLAYFAAAGVRLWKGH